MASKKTNANIKNEILNTAKHMFYERGYNETYYMEICKVIKISPGTFHYYYKSKDILAGLIIDDISWDLNTKIQEVLKIDNIKLRNILIMLIYYDLLENNENFKRFYIELSDKNILCPYTIDTTIGLIQKIFDSIEESNSTYVNPYAYMFSYMQSGLFNAYLKGKLELCFQEIVDLCTITMFSPIFNQTHAEIHKMITEARKFLHGFVCNMTNDFKINICKK